jgi:hypothetical protein
VCSTVAARARIAAEDTANTSINQEPRMIVALGSQQQVLSNSLLLPGLRSDAHVELTATRRTMIANTFYTNTRVS